MARDRKKSLFFAGTAPLVLASASPRRVQLLRQHCRLFVQITFKRVFKFLSNQPRRC